jgi:protein O-mannosyl-transferase
LQVGLIIFLLGFCTYFFSIFNGFVADDNVYILANTQIRNFDWSTFLSGSSYYSGDATRLSGIYYKPLFTFVTSLLFVLSGGHAWLFHLVQILLHIINSFLLYIFFSRLLRKDLSLFLTLIFLVHSGNTESVVYIADLQDVMFFMFGILAVVLVQTGSINIKKGLWVGFFLLLSLLAKESGLMFLPTIIVTVWISNRNHLRSTILTSTLVFVTYLFLRFGVAHVQINHQAISPIMKASFETRVLTMPKIVYSYLRLFFWPIKLSWGQQWIVNRIDFENFVLPIGAIFSLSATMIWFFKKLLQKEKIIFAYFIAITAIGLGMHAQLIPLDFTFAERWAYFPMIGFLGLMGVVLLHFENKIFHSNTVLFVAMGILLVLSLRTTVRSLNWKNDFTLVSHDILLDPNSLTLQNNLGYELMNRGQFELAKDHLEKSISLYPDQSSLNNLAFVYAKLGVYEKSLDTYKQALILGDYYLTYQNYIAELIRQKKIDLASNEITIALKKYPNNPRLWLLLTAIEYNSGNTENAIQAAQRANGLSPGVGNYLLLKIQQNQPIAL